MDITHCYSGETIHHTDGIDYAIIDTGKLDFSKAQFGKKTKPTLVRLAKAGETIVTSPGKAEEIRYSALGGEVVFVNQLPGGVEDSFVPRTPSGQPNGQEVLDKKYELVGGDLCGEGAFFRPKGAPLRILHEVVVRPTVIIDAYGSGNHQFLGEGATLKKEGEKRPSGIDKAAFDETWSITDKTGRIQPKGSKEEALGLY